MAPIVIVGPGEDELVDVVPGIVVTEDVKLELETGRETDVVMVESVVLLLLLD